MRVIENHWDAGRRGEDLALELLLSKKYHLIHRNYRFGKGEIDLIMHSPDNVLVFVEVKSGRTTNSGSPLERIDGRKIRQLQKIALRYCWEFHQEERDMRFDVVGVKLKEGCTAQLEHIESAFIPEGVGYYP